MSQVGSLLNHHTASRSLPVLPQRGRHLLRKRLSPLPLPHRQKKPFYQDVQGFFRSVRVQRAEEVGKKRERKLACSSPFPRFSTPLRALLQAFFELLARINPLLLNSPVTSCKLQQHLLQRNLLLDLAS